MELGEEGESGAVDRSGDIRGLLRDRMIVGDNDWTSFGLILDSCGGEAFAKGIYMFCSERRSQE